jgi:hypothetical protein
MALYSTTQPISVLLMWYMEHMTKWVAAMQTYRSSPVPGRVMHNNG